MSDFNENNNTMKDLNKADNLDNIKKFLDKNKELVDQCQNLKERAKNAVAQCIDLNDELDNIQTVQIPEMNAEIDEKYTLIQKADDIYDTLSKVLDEKIAECQ